MTIDKAKSPEWDPRELDVNNATDNMIIYTFYHELGEFLSHFEDAELKEMAIKGTIFKSFMLKFPEIAPVNTL